MEVKASFGLFTFPLEPQAYGSLIYLRAGDILDIASFDSRRSTAKLSLFESDLSDEQQLVRITGAELKTDDFPEKIDPKRQQTRRAESPGRIRRENVTEKIYAHVQLYANGNLIKNFSEDQSGLGYAALANSGNLKFDCKNYKIDFRYIYANYNELADIIEDIYWEIHLIES